MRPNDKPPALSSVPHFAFSVSASMRFGERTYAQIMRRAPLPLPPLFSRFLFSSPTPPSTGTGAGGPAPDRHDPEHCTRLSWAK